MRGPTRRSALHAAGLALLGSLTGCSTLPTEPSGTDDLDFERLDSVAVHVADDVDLSMPDEVETVNARHNADLLILADGTDVEVDQVIEWLDDENAIALLGDGAEATWLSWARSDAFEDAYANEGVSDAEPDPYLVVGARIGLHVTTYRRSWADGPRDRDVLRSLDEILVDIEEETPRSN